MSKQAQTSLKRAADAEPEGSVQKKSKSAKPPTIPDEADLVKVTGGTSDVWRYFMKYKPTDLGHVYCRIIDKKSGKHCNTCYKFDGVSLMHSSVPNFKFRFVAEHWQHENASAASTQHRPQRQES